MSTMKFPTNPSPETHTQNLPDRRSILGGLGMVGLGWLASSASASAADAPAIRVLTKSAAAPPRHQALAESGEIPADWARNQGSTLSEYVRYLSTLKLKNISPGQVIAAHAKQKGDIWNVLPPKQWWTRMGYTLRVADYIAKAMNVKEVEIVSAYRSPVYNAHCEGAKAGSWHQANVAVDIKFPVAAHYVTAAARNLRDRGLFKGGVGGYDNFTHVDTRGVNTNW